MNFMAFGKDLSGAPLFPVLSEEKFRAGLLAGLGRNAAALEQQARQSAINTTFRGEVVRSVIDVGDPLKVGWTYLVSRQDPQSERVRKLIEPLARKRGMPDPAEALVLDGQNPDEWADWLEEHYFALHLDGKKVPQYILLIGSPKYLPFRFQSLLSTVANVGRLDFDCLEDLETYVQKVITLESLPDPVVERQVLLFAPDVGQSDPTYYSRQYMVEPLRDHVRDELHYPTIALTGFAATKQRFEQELHRSRPALVYSASHGLGLTGRSLEEQMRLNGALVCQSSGPLTSSSLFCADDVPLDRPFLEGAVFFQFACFGYGTPAQSDYAHWIEGMPDRYADEDFVAALPKRLLAHPHGPIAFVGHLDTAFMHAFMDPSEPAVADRWHHRMEPFVAAVDRLLNVQPSGLAMEDMSKRYATHNTVLTNFYDRLQRDSSAMTPQRTGRFIDCWIERGDAQNYMVFGDPAARLRIPEA